ncbi:MAG: hypothetical protein K2I26_08630 [Paramuribaculum sp.]|nr:hypothetical protein [Paramuribaculum sp.]
MELKRGCLTMFNPFNVLLVGLLCFAYAGFDYWGRGRKGLSILFFALALVVWGGYVFVKTLEHLGYF